MRFPAGATPEQVRAIFAKQHAEGAARARAILTSEGYEPPKPRSKATAPIADRHRARAAAVSAKLAAKAAEAGHIWVRIDVKTTNPLNAASASARKFQARPKAKQRELARSLVSAHLGRRSPLPCVVRLVRVAPSSGLDDHDGLRAALKAIVDGVADALGLTNDRDPRVTWVYDQRRGVPREYAVELTIER